MQIKTFPVTAFGQNCRLIWDDPNHAFVIDPGGEADEIFALSQKLGLKIEKILLTHGHLDHVGGAVALKTLTGAEILGSHIKDKFLFDALPWQAQTFGLPEIAPFYPDRWLKEEEIIQLGGIKLEVLHLPGHSPGHIGFLNRENNLAFVGDVLFQGSIGRTDLPQGDLDTLMHSIHQKLLPLGDEIQIFSGHGNPTTLGEERRNNPFLQPTSSIRSFHFIPQ